MNLTNNIDSIEDEIKVTVEGDLLEINANGNGNFEWIEKFWSFVSAECERTTCRKVLAVVRTTEPLRARDAFVLISLFQRLGLKSLCRIAWVELNPDMYRAAALGETVLMNRYYPIRLFNNATAAREWLSRE